MQATVIGNNLAKKGSSMEESKVSDFFALLKPRVMLLVVFTGFVGMYIAPGNIHPFMAIVATFCIALGSGAAGAINMWYERDIDSIMKRTKNRPIPRGAINPTSALEFAVIMAFASVFIMAMVINFIAAFVLLVAILFYVFIYTIWLKRRTPQNIVIGGAAGAFPPIIGWAAVTGNISLESVILFLIIFLWTPPHFWALALYRSDDYERAGIPMLPVIRGNKTTRINIFVYSLLLALASFLPFMLGFAGKFYFVSLLMLNGYFLFLAYKLLNKYEEILAKKLFGFSIIYLFLLFAILLIEKMVF